MWGTTSTGKELTGNFGDALEDTSIGDCRLFRLFARNQSQGILGLLQHYRHKCEVKTGSENVCLSVKTGSDRHTVRMTRMTRSRPRQFALA
jgi:hypothetical protein